MTGREVCVCSVNYNQYSSLGSDGRFLESQYFFVLSGP